MSALAHRTVESNGIRMHIAEQGEGPLVLLLHGWPESWYSWRHQLTALAEAGFHAVAPDQRGYGDTDSPEAIDQYTMFHLVGDVVGLIDALGEGPAVVVGHDWGAPVAWHTAMLRPDLVRGVVGLSVPPPRRAPAPPIGLLRKALGDGFYQAYFQQPGVAEAEFSRDPRTTLRRILFGGSGDSSGLVPVVPEGKGFLDLTEEPAELPGWLTEADIDTFAEQFTRSGFSGGLNWYRNIDRNWELTAPWHGASILPPALYVSGDRDLVRQFPGMDDVIAKLSGHVPNLRGVVDLPGCGHWTQQERPAEVNAALLEFLKGL